MGKRPKRILVFGYFGYVTDQLDGQTVKTRAIYELLKERHDGRVDFADSQQFRHSIGSVFRFFRDLARCNVLVWLPARNNFKYLFPVIWMLSKLFRFKILYLVIGGWLSDFIGELPLHGRLLHHIEKILVENLIVKQELESRFGISNSIVFPNFRELSPAPVQRESDGVLRLVFLARVHRMKGLEILQDLCEYISSSDKLAHRISLDFYGQINEPDKNYFFDNLVNKFEFVEYHGPLNPSLINLVLQKYDMLVLPTRWFTEGFPGSILDAYQAGIPVAVTAWKHAREFVADGKSGFIVDFDNPLPELKDIVTRLAYNPSELKSMKEKAYRESLRYTPDVAWSLLSAFIS